MPASPRTIYLLNYVFLVGLIILAFNDFYWKATFGNWWTGKLSDFAGVLIFPLFLKYLFGWRNTVVILVSVMLFVWWKSPFSEGFLSLLNLQGFVYFQRVIDFSDLLAFFVLPLSWWILRQPEHFEIKFSPPAAAPLARYALLPTCVFFFVATSTDEFPFISGSNEDCCAQEPVDVMVGNARIYIPSAFTPDGDGLNDFFQIVGDSNVVRVDSFRVYTLPDSIVVFRADSLTSFNAQEGYDGEVFGEISSATFAFAIQVVAEDGTTRLLRNRVCALPCPAPPVAPGPRFLSTCTFGSQLDSLEHFDRSVDSGESLSCY